MSTERDVTMTIFGEMKSVEAVKKLAETFADYVCPDWNKPQFQEDSEGISHIIEALEKGIGITVIRLCTGMELDEISAVCREHDLSYKIIISGGDLKTAYLNVWTPQFEEEKTFECNEGGYPVVAIADIAKKIRANPKNVLTILDELEASALVGVKQVATASPELIAEINNFLENRNEAAPSVA